MESLLPLPGVVDDNPVSRWDPTADWPIVERALTAAVENLDRMRLEEGRFMAADMQANCQAAATHLEQIRQRSVLLPSCYLVYALYNSFRNRTVSGGAAGCVKALSAATFGIFLLDTHTTYSEKLFELTLNCQPYVGRYMCSILSILLEFAVYFLAVSVLRKIPGVKSVL